MRYKLSLETTLLFLWGMHTPPSSLGIPSTVPSFGLKSIAATDVLHLWEPLGKENHGTAEWQLGVPHFKQTDSLWKNDLGWNTNSISHKAEPGERLKRCLKLCVHLLWTLEPEKPVYALPSHTRQGPRGGQDVFRGTISLTSTQTSRSLLSEQHF